MKAELEQPTRTRPLKRFKVHVTVKDADHNEIAVADLAGELEASDIPQVTVAVMEEVVQVPQDNPDMEEGNEVTKAQPPENDAKEGGESNRSDTVTAGVPEDEVDQHIDVDLTDLGSIMETVMGRQWFQLFVNREVDDAMVRKRWGASALEVFQVNRDMMELMQGERDTAANRSQDADLRVGPMSDGEESLASSGAKVFPRRTVVAGRRGDDSVEGGTEAAEAIAETGEDDNAREARHPMPISRAEEEMGRVLAENEHREGNDDGHIGAGNGGGLEEGGSETSQQVLENTQMDVVEPMEGEAMDGEAEAGEGSSTTGMTGTTEGLHDGSFGDGKVQTDLQSWLK